MLLDLIDTNNYAMYNIKLAQLVGLEAAAYCSQLLTIQSKAQRKQKLFDGYFKVERNYIWSQTALSTERQLSLDENLLRLGIISKREVDFIQVNIDTLSALIANDDINLQTELVSLMKGVKDQKKVLKQQAQLSKQQSINQNLLESLNCPTPELREAMRNWIEAVNQDTTTKPLNKVAVASFYHDINAYTKCEDLDLAIKLINIATTHYWKTAQAAIDKYEQSKKQVATAAQYRDGTTEKKLEIKY